MTARALYARWTLLAAVAVSALPGAARAQVIGYNPETSPYRDVDTPQSLSIFGGYLHAETDPAGVDPQSAPVVGLRDQIHLGGPAMLIVRLTYAFSDRDVINPSLPESSRIVGVKSSPITFLDTDIGFNLFGERAWHNLQPEINLGPGLVSDLGQPADVGGYSFGTKLALNFGGGVRWVPPGRWSAHLNADVYLYSFKYPTSYHTIAIDGTQVIPSSKSLTGYTHNGMFVFGISYALFH
jgi:hypothetical protein